MVTRWSVLALAAGSFVLIVGVAGFFHSEDKEASAQKLPEGRQILRGALPHLGMESEELVMDRTAPNSPGKGSGEPMTWSLPFGGAYRRAAEFQVKVKDSIKADDDIEKTADEVGGTLLDLVLEGTDGARRGVISFKIPSDKVNVFIKAVRGLGMIQHERITAQHLGEGSGGKVQNGEMDEREFSLVRVNFWDEAVAPEVKEGRGLFAASFNKSASHFLKGLAVFIELTGLVLPYMLAAGLILAPILAVVRMRRRARLLVRA